MRFKITLETTDNTEIPINYQYPLSAAIYKVLEKGNKTYADFLHGSGYGKGFKFFTFSQLYVPFEIHGSRLRLKRTLVTFEVTFHIPEAVEHFIKGLFQSEQIVIGNRNVQGFFKVRTIETLPNALSVFMDNEIVRLRLRPVSPLVVGFPNEGGNYDYLAPGDERFVDGLTYNWKSKIDAVYVENEVDPLLLVDVFPLKNGMKSRLISIKEGSLQETKIRGWLGFELEISATKKHLELLLNSGAGLYNAQGFGCLKIVDMKKRTNNVMGKLYG